jgi:hypothetical protein
LVGTSITEYKRTLAKARQVTRPTDKDKEVDASAQDLVGRVITFGFTEREEDAEDAEKWLALIGTALPPTATLPLRNNWYWLKRFEAGGHDDLFVIDCAYTKATQVIEPAGVEGNVHVTAAQFFGGAALGIWKIPGWQQLEGVDPGDTMAPWARRS